MRRYLGAIFTGLLALAAITVSALIFHPDSPLPDGWNPRAPLNITDAPTALTSWKLGRVAGNDALCLTALGTGASFTPQPARTGAGACGIGNPVIIDAASGINIAPLETSCAVALRLAMWTEHSIKPAAADALGWDVSQLHHIGSYNCRSVRGSQSRLSTHATAEAIDITGVTFANGNRLSLITHWDAGDDRAAFLRTIRDGACRWFVTTLSPDYNALHADHFHLQSRGWGSCR